MGPDRLHEVWVAGQHAWAATSDRGRVIEVEGAGHQIAVERPDLVVDTVRSVLQPAD